MRVPDFYLCTCVVYTTTILWYLFKEFINLEISGPEVLGECSPPYMCHMSCDMCHMSHVICCMSRIMVTWHMSQFVLYLCLGQISEASRWRIRYQHHVLIFMLSEKLRSPLKVQFRSFFLTHVYLIFEYVIWTTFSKKYMIYGGRINIINRDGVVVAFLETALELTKSWGQDLTKWYLKRRHA